MSQKNPLETLIYISSAKGAMSPTDVEDILRASRHNNALRGISGVLLYAEGGFIQVLEGPTEALRKTFLKISVDPRHSNVIVLYQKEISERIFGNWKMGAHKIDLPGVSEQIFQLTPEAINDMSIGSKRDAVDSLLKTFLKVNLPHCAA